MSSHYFAREGEEPALGGIDPVPNSPNRSGFRHLRTLFSVGAVGGLPDGALLELFLARRGEDAESAFAALLPDFAKLFRSEDFQERIKAAKENRIPVFHGR